MPIYAYRCSKCSFEKEYLQKLSDPLLTVCPECGESSFTKQLTAAGFQLKGSGWYATDFKSGKSGKSGAKPAESPDSGTSDAGKSDAGKSDKPTTESAASGHACGTGACSTCS